MKQPVLKMLVSMTYASLCGVLTGALTALVIMLYKFCTGAAISLSERGYNFLREHLYWLPVVIIGFGLIAVLLALIYKKYPYMQGGGIPTSIGILRGFIVFDWFKNLFGTFILSLISFVIGVPLGNEGPSAQMGTAVGRGVARAFDEKYRALDRYAMTGGACAGFSSATEAPISGILFAIEEAHGKISPLILLVSAVSVLSARAVTELLSPVFGVSVSLLPDLQVTALPVRDLWLPILIGISVGLFSVLFLRYYHVIYKLLQSLFKKCHHALIILIIFILTLAAGLLSSSFVSTGHDLILDLLQNTPLLPLLLILLVRTTLTLSANATGITGGVFVPVLSLGALVSAILCNALKSVFDISAEYSDLILLLGIAACVAGMMKMPLTAIVFAVEVLSCHANLLPVITVSVTAFAITELFGVHSINEHVLERKLQKLNTDKIATVYDAFVTVQSDSFIVGKQLRDILWPANLFVLSVKHAPNQQAMLEVSGDMVFKEGDLLHVRYSTFDSLETRKQLVSIVGEQEYSETKTENI